MAPPPRGYRRSRALWDRARLLSRQQHPPGSSFSSRAARLWQSLAAYGSAVAYELQPFRMSQLRRDTGLGNTSDRWNFRLSLSTWWHILDESLGSGVLAVAHFLRERSLAQWLAVAGLVLYYWLVRWAHEWLHAGPIVLMATVLAILATIGLGDHNNDGGPSAYSVFNRGRRLLGDLNADDMLAQYVGGGWANPRPPDDDDDPPD